MLGDRSDDGAVGLVLDCRPSGPALNRPDWSFNADDASDAVEARQSFRLHLHRIGCAASFVEEAQMVFGELVGNVVRHAPGPIKIFLRWESEAALISVFDSGPQFETKPELPRDPFADSGRGLYIVRSLAESLWLEPAPGGKAVHARLRASPTLHASA